MRIGASTSAARAPPPALKKAAEQLTAGLKPQEQAEVRALAQRDQEVRAHEQAHKTAGGAHSGAIHYEQTSGPDNRQYAVGGHVSIDVSPVANDPHATVQKMKQVYGAALAPMNPSSQDRSVAAQAKQTEREAQAEIAAEKRTETEALVGGSQRAYSASKAPPPGALLSLVV